MGSHVFVLSFSESDLGFRYDWSTDFIVSDVTSSGPADQILCRGDRIIKVSECTARLKNCNDKLANQITYLACTQSIIAQTI